MDEGRAALLLLGTDGLRHTRSTLLALLCCAVSLRRSKRSSSFWRGFPSIYRVTSAQAGRKRGEKEGLERKVFCLRGPCAEQTGPTQRKNSTESFHRILTTRLHTWRWRFNKLYPGPSGDRRVLLSRDVVILL